MHEKSAVLIVDLAREHLRTIKLIDVEPDSILFMANDCKTYTLGKSPDYINIKRECLDTIYRNAQKSFECNADEDEAIAALSPEDYKKFLNINKKRWEEECYAET